MSFTGRGVEPLARKKVDIPPPDAPTEDPASKQLAEDEAAAFSKESLERNATLNSHKRKQSLLSHFHTAMVIVFWLGVVLFIFSITFWAYHLLIPDCWHFLSVEQIQRIEQTLLTAGAGAAMHWAARNLN